MQKAIFPLRHSWQSQEMYGPYSHKEIRAIDCGVLTQYKDYNLYAPFDGTIVYVDRPSAGGGIAFQSDNKVEYVNGTKDYMTLWTAHDNTPSKVGTKFKQGEIYSRMGTAGGVARHCHLEVQKGKFKKATKYTSQGSYKFDNMIEPFNALFLTEDTIFKYSDYKWTRLPDTIGTPVERNEYVDQIEVIVDLLRARKEPSLKGSILGFTEKGIYNIISKTEADDYTWYQIEDNIWIAYNSEWEILYPKKESELDRLKRENEELRKLNEILQKTNLALKDDLEASDNKNKELLDKLKQINNISKV